MNTSEKLADVAALVLEAGQPVLFKRLIHASVALAKHDTDEELREGIEEDAEENEELYTSDDLEDEDEDDDKDVVGFVGLPVGALPHKERRRGPHPKDIGVAKPDWWNPDTPEETEIWNPDDSEEDESWFIT